MHGDHLAVKAPMTQRGRDTVTCVPNQSIGCEQDGSRPCLSSHVRLYLTKLLSNKERGRSAEYHDIKMRHLSSYLNARLLPRSRIFMLP